MLVYYVNLLYCIQSLSIPPMIANGRCSSHFVVFYWKSANLIGSVIFLCLLIDNDCMHATLETGNYS